MDERCFLVLKDGSSYRGRGFGFRSPLVSELEPGTFGFKNAGEVVFNTAMAGYHEVLTDPSYTGQLVAMTYPHVGNYGALAEWSEIGPEGDGRPGVKPAGFVLRGLYRGPVPEDRMTLDAFLRENETPGITDVDTRHLTLRLRDEGSVSGVICRSPRGEVLDLNEDELAQARAYLEAFPEMVGRNLIGDVGTREVVEINPTGAPHVALLDCGSKANIIRELTKRSCRITLFPSTSSAEEVLSAKPDGVMVSNGPGDPAVLGEQIESIRALIGKTAVTGICLGHQLISEALGAKTYKMKFGHHGVNHPVRDEFTRRVFVTSQNHGFAVEEDSLPDDAEVWFRNANDGSIEGINADGRRVRSAQFHPESAPGPNDSRWIFDSFLELMQE